VGRYTARAVAAQAFGRSVAAIDTNVARVVTRVFGVSPGPGSRASVQRLGDAWVAARRPVEWTHAMMDLGATVCLAGDPRCGRCPLQQRCASAGKVGTAAMMAATPGNRRTRGDHRSPPRFEATRRWLRGRIVARLTESPDGAWIAIDGPLGSHSAASVDAALVALAAEGVLERDARGSVRLARNAA